MKKFTQVLLIAFLSLSFAVSQKNDDESKPYEFGFTIDGQQHRHEKKDVKGIIQGEFGFITADGIYHVTVYATDENGKFKILSTKNLRISAPLDGSPLRGELDPEAAKYRSQAGLAPLPQAAPPAPPAPSAPPAPAAPPALPTPPPNPLAIPQPVPEQQVVVSTPKSQAPFRFTTQPTIKPACASCGYITTVKPKPGDVANGFQFQNPIFQKQDQENQQPFVRPGSQSEGPLSVPISIPSSGSGEDNQSQGPQNTQSIGGQAQSPQYPGNNLPQYQTANGPQNTNYNSIEGAQYPSGGTQNTQYPSGGEQGAQFPSGTGGAGGAGEAGGAQYSSGGGSQGAQYPDYSGNSGFGGNGPAGTSGSLGGSGPGGYGGSVGGDAAANPLQVSNQAPPAEVSNFPPVSVSDGVIQVGGKNKQEIPIKDKYPGMQDGLPEGIEEKDISDLLYKFHYTVGFHGHYEKGLKNGAKVGGYFVNGRDGISRVVTYVADENGYRPKVKFINLGLTSDDTPKPETEKTFGLKDFEFVWYPVE